MRMYLIFTVSTILTAVLVFQNPRNTSFSTFKTLTKSNGGIQLEKKASTKAKTRIGSERSTFYLPLMVLDLLESFNMRLRRMIFQSNFDIVGLESQLVDLNNNFSTIRSPAESLSSFESIGIQLALADDVLRSMNNSIPDLSYCKPPKTRVKRCICAGIELHLKTLVFAGSASAPDFRFESFMTTILTLWNSTNSVEIAFKHLPRISPRDMTVFLKYVNQRTYT